MALTDSQRKAPHRPISQRNYTSYLERSFEEGRLDEMQEWWDLGVVQKILQASDDEGQPTPHHRRLMIALSKGVGYASVPSQWWDRLLDAGGARGASSQSVAWLSHWAARPDMLEKAVGYDYNLFTPYDTYRSDRKHSMWHTLVARALDTYAYRKPSPEECARILDFLEKNLDPPLLVKNSAEDLGDALDTLMWKDSFCKGAQAERFESWCNRLIDAGADCKPAFARWCSSSYKAYEADPAWGRIGIKLATRASTMNYDEMSGLIKSPQGFVVAQAAWVAGASLYPSYKFSIGGSKTHLTMADALWEVSHQGRKHQPNVVAWFNALAEAAALRAEPAPDDWAYTVLERWKATYPKSDFTPEQFESWLPQCAAIVRVLHQAGAPSKNVQYAFSTNLARVGFDTWDAAQRQRWWDTMDAALEGGMGNWWAQHVDETRVRWWWWKEVTESPKTAAALASDPASPWAALTWHTLMDRLVVSEELINDPGFWEADSTWKKLILGAAATVDKVNSRLGIPSDETPLARAISAGEVLLAHALLDNGARAGLDTADLWTSFARMARSNKNTIKAVALLDKLVLHGAQLNAPERPRNSLIVSLLKNPDVDPVLVRAIHAHGADFSFLENMSIQGQSEGHQLALSLLRASRMADVLGEDAPTARRRPRM